MAPLFFFLIFQKYTPGVSSLNSRHLSVVFAYGHTTLSTPDLVRSRKLSRVGPVSTWMGRPPGNTRCCKLLLFLHWAANTLLSSFSIHAFSLTLINLIAASFLPFDFSVTSFCFRCDKMTAQPLRSSFLLQGAIDRLFLATTWESTLLDFKFKFHGIQRKTNSQVHVVLMLVTGLKNYLQGEQIKYFSFFFRNFCLVLGNKEQESHQLKKNSMK